MLCVCACNGAVKQGGMLLRPLSWHGFSIKWDQEGNVTVQYGQPVNIHSDVTMQCRVAEALDREVIYKCLVQ